MRKTLNRQIKTLGIAVTAIMLSAEMASAQSYEDWLWLHFTYQEQNDESVAGLNADPDYDGRTNFMEYAAGSNPKAFDQGGVQASRGPDGRLRLNFPRRTTTTGLLYIPQVSSDLAAWFTGGDAIEELSAVQTSGFFDSVIIRDTIANPNPSKRFIRLYVATDSDGDGLPDEWEILLFGNLDQVGAGDFDLDGFSNLWEWQHGGGQGAADYYNGALPTLLIVGGNEMTTVPFKFAVVPLAVEIRDGAGATLGSAPIRFEVVSGGGGLRADSPGTHTDIVDLRTDASGRVEAVFWSGATVGETRITATARSGSGAIAVQFTEHTLAPPAAPDDFINSSPDPAAVLFTWSDEADNETGYQIWHTADDGATWTVVATAAANAEAATVAVTALPGGGTAGAFAINAVNAAGSSTRTFDPDFAYRDNDGDTLPNAHEEVLGTDLNEADTDEDGTDDSLDILPLDPDLNQYRVPAGNCSVVDLTLLGLSAADGVGRVNDSGQMIVYRAGTEADPDGGPHLFDGTELSPIPLSSVVDLNNSGTVLGFPEYDPDALNTDAATWTAGQSVPNRRYGYEPVLPDPAVVVQPVGARAYAINGSGAIVGTSSAFINGASDLYDQYLVGTRWAGSTAYPVGDVYYYRDDVPNRATPLDINDSGLIVGEVDRSSAVSAPYSDAFVSSGGAITRLPGLPDNRYAGADAVNSDGVIVGSELPESDLAFVRAVLWANVGAAWKRKNLGAHDTATGEAAVLEGYPSFVTDRLEIFGSFYPESGSVKQLWRNGELADLATTFPEGWIFASASGMNNQGVMSGRATPVVDGVPTGPSRSALRIRCDLGIDGDLDGFLGDADLPVKAYPRSLIVDVNNGLVNNVRRNADATLDLSERNNSGYGPSTRVEPLRLQFSLPVAPAKCQVLLRLSSHSAKLRVFDNSTPPVAVLGETASGEQLEYPLNAVQKNRRYPDTQTFWIEGIEAGEAEIEMEIWDADYALAQPYGKDRIHLEVNADREPIQSGDVPKFPNRWRARAVKTVAGGIRGIQAELSSVEPLLSWHKKPLRSGATASFWIGFEATPPLGQQMASWAQTGFQARVPTNSSPARTGSNVYAEIAGNYPLFLQTGDVRYYTKEGYPSEIPIPGDNEWKRRPTISQRIEYLPNASNRFQDRILIHIPHSSGGMTPVQLAASDTSGSQPAVDLREFNYDTYQASAEMTASVIRLPGTPGSPGGIKDLEIKTGLGGSVSPNWQSAGFVAADLQIVALNADGGSVTHQTNSHLHYNISLESPGYVRFWDQYRWTEKEAKDWIVDP